jgi:hypothetical protein
MDIFHAYCLFDFAYTLLKEKYLGHLLMREQKKQIRA